MNKLKTPYKNLMILALFGLVIAVSQNERFNRLELRSEVYTLRQDNNSLKAALLQRDSVIRASYNEVKRIEYALHSSDTLDGIITYKEKLLVSARGIDKVNNLDLR